MRYQDWDVLLFPAESKVPLQEFKTACFVAQELVNPTQIHTAGLPSTSYLVDHAVPRPLPIVAGFVPNLPCGSPFRVSVHSWHPPIASRLTLAIAPQEDMVYFEARVSIDGNCVARHLFNNIEPSWPQVIDTCAQVDKNGNQMDLKFPPFHQEMLNQTWWNAGEDMGRIRITIAEGIGHSETAFQKIKTIVAFSFQHAPLDHLETVGVAWPNPGMWYPNPQAIFNATSPRKIEAPSDPDAHAHSPRRHAVSNSNQGPTPSSEMIPPWHLSPQSKVHGNMGPPLLPNQRRFLEANSWPSLPPMPDPFMISRKPRSGRGSSYDEVMPDYSYSTTSTSSRNLSNEVSSEMAWSAPDSTQHDLEDGTHGLPPAHSSPPMTDAVRFYSGTFAPANTRVSSAANTPPIQTRPSAAATARASSYSHAKNRSVSVAIKDSTLPEVEQSSRLNGSVYRQKPLRTLCIEDSSPKIHTRPADFVKSRKEGNSSEATSLPKPQNALSVESTQLRSTNISSGEKENATSDSKRKRLVSAAGQKLIIDEGPPDLSPTRRMSKVIKVKTGSASDKGIEHDEPLVDDLAEEGVVIRRALGEIHNIQ